MRKLCQDCKWCDLGKETTSRKYCVKYLQRLAWKNPACTDFILRNKEEIPAVSFKNFQEVTL